MAWFRNHYVCTVCEGHWIAEHEESLEQHCPHCRAYDVTPYRSDDLTIIVMTPASAQDAVVALKATAAKMRGAAHRPRSRRTARAAAH